MKPGVPDHALLGGDHHQKVVGQGWLSVWCWRQLGLVVTRLAGAAAASCGSFGPDVDTRTRHQPPTPAQHMDTPSFLSEEHHQPII